MLRALVLVLAVLLPSLSWAQAPACIPGLYGPQFRGSKLVPLTRGNAGWYGYGWCTRSDGAPYPVYRLCAHGECASDIGAVTGRTMASLALQLVGKTPEEVYGSWWAANPPEFKCWPPSQAPAPGTPRALACGELENLLERDQPAYTPPEPAGYTHFVKPLTKPDGTSSKDRPVREIKEDGKPYDTKLRAIVGQPCGEVRLPTTGKDVWAEFGPQFEPNLVALCSPKTTPP